MLYRYKFMHCKTEYESAWEAVMIMTCNPICIDELPN